jgi:uncharacterized membrane protein
MKQMTKLQKILGAILIIAMLVSVGAVFAQEDETTTTDTAFCIPMRGMMGDNPVRSALDELGLTQQDLRDYILAGGTIADFLTEHGIDLEALRAAHHAENQVALLSCVNDAETNGLITSEQANQLREAIANDTLYELMQSGEFDGLFPRFGGRHGHFGQDNGFGAGMMGTMGETNGFGAGMGAMGQGRGRHGVGGNGFGMNGQ